MKIARKQVTIYGVSFTSVEHANISRLHVKCKCLTDRRIAPLTFLHLGALVFDVWKQDMLSWDSSRAPSQERMKQMLRVSCRGTSCPVVADPWEICHPMVRC